MARLCLLFFGLAVAAQGADVASPDFLGIVSRYADTMIEHGRDTYGPQKSGLLLSPLNRTTLTPLKVRPPPPGGIRRGGRPGRPWVEMNGANPHLDQNLLRILYSLSDITGDTRYAKVADEELSWFFHHTMSPKTDLLPWGEQVRLWRHRMVEEPAQLFISHFGVTRVAGDVAQGIENAQQILVEMGIGSIHLDPGPSRPVAAPNAAWRRGPDFQRG